MYDGVILCIAYMVFKIYMSCVFVDKASTFGRPLDTLVVHRSSPPVRKTSLAESVITEEDSHDEGVPLIVSRIVNHVERNGKFPIVHIYPTYIHEDYQSIHVP